MNRSNRSSALLPSLCLILGLVAGYGLAHSLPGRRPSELGTTSSPPAALSLRESATPEDLEEPDVTLTPRREAPEDDRVAIPPARDATGGAQAPSPRRELDPTLARELTAYLRSGMYEEQMRKDGGRVQEFLAIQYARAGEPHRALELLESFPTLDDDAYLTVAAHLVRAGDEKAASRAYLKAFELEPLDEDVLDEWREVDPASGLAAVEARVAELGEEAPIMLSLQRARFLSALDRTYEAVALVRGLLGNRSADPWALELLSEFDPEVAERELRSRLGSDPEGLVAVQLAQQLVESDRDGEAIALLEEALAQAPSSSRALSELAQLEPGRVLSYLDSPAAEKLDSDALSQTADILLEEGNEAGAVDLWVRSFELDLANEDAIQGLREHAPTKLWERCRQIVRDSADDETLGDVADMYWNAGRREEAIELWRRANLIDPTDSEWSDNLRSLVLGEDPL